MSPLKSKRFFLKVITLVYSTLVACVSPCVKEFFKSHEILTNRPHLERFWDPDITRLFLLSTGIILKLENLGNRSLLQKGKNSLYTLSKSWKTHLHLYCVIFINFAWLFVKWFYSFSVDLNHTIVNRQKDTLVGTFVVFGARIHTVLLLKLVFISRQSVMAERITHGVLCKLECTICMHQRRSNLFAGWRYTIRKVFFNMF